MLFSGGGDLENMKPGPLNISSLYVRRASILVLTPDHESVAEQPRAVALIKKETELQGQSARFPFRIRPFTFVAKH